MRSFINLVLRHAHISGFAQVVEQLLLPKTFSLITYARPQTSVWIIIFHTVSNLYGRLQFFRRTLNGMQLSDFLCRKDGPRENMETNKSITVIRKFVLGITPPSFLSISFNSFSSCIPFLSLTFQRISSLCTLPFVTSKCHLLLLSIYSFIIFNCTFSKFVVH